MKRRTTEDGVVGVAFVSIWYKFFFCSTISQLGGFWQDILLS
jgi:hypothetical protein